MVHVQRPPNFSTAPSNPCRFPSRPPAFGFSPRLQNRLLEHVAQVRERVGHSTGLLVMATALGKTVFCILDIQRLFLAPSRRDSPVDVEQGRGCGSRSGLRGRGSGASRNGETRKRRRDAEGERASGGGCLRTEGARGPEECREGASVVQEKTRCGGKGKEAEDVEVVEETDDDVSDSGAVQERRVRGVEEDGKMVPDYRTVKREVSEKVWKQHLGGVVSLGLSPLRDGKVKWGAVDIDVYPYLETVDELADFFNAWRDP